MNKKVLYKNERQILLEKIYKIIHINENNKSFFEEDFLNSYTALEIYYLKDEIEEYFDVRRWKDYNDFNLDIPSTHYSIFWFVVKNIFRNMKVKYKSSRVYEEDRSKHLITILN